jgi:hypothetical protein
MSFYATLPSNSSFEYYPENTLNNYTTKLHSTLRLEENYEVGLVEMSYQQNWIYKKDGVITLKLIKRLIRFKSSFKIMIHLNQSLKMLRSFVNEKDSLLVFVQ